MKPELKLFIEQIKKSRFCPESDEPNENPYENCKELFLNSATDMLEVVRVYPYAVLDLPESLKDNKDFILSLIDIKPTIFNHFESMGHYEKSEFILAEVGLSCSSEKLRNDRAFVEKCLKIDPTLFYQVGDELLHNTDFLKKCITDFEVKSYQFLNDVRLDSDFAKKHLRTDISLSKYLEPNLWDDVGFLLEHKDHLYDLLNKSTQVITNNEKIMLDFCEINFSCSAYASQELKDNPAFLIKLIKLDKANEIIETYSDTDFSFISNPFFSDEIDSLLRITINKNTEVISNIETFLKDLLVARENNFHIDYKKDFYTQFNYQNLNNSLNSQSTNYKKPKI